MKFSLLWQVIFLLGSFSWAWKEWDYNVTWSHAGSANSPANQKSIWEAVWDIPGAFQEAQAAPPRPRRGHSLHIIKTNEASTEYQGAYYIVMFGGRDNDQETLHIPKTYNVETVSHRHTDKERSHFFYR